MTAGKCASITSLAVAFPTLRRPNAYWEERHPEMVAKARAHASTKVWRPPREGDQASAFDEAMRPYFDDPFLGAQERRWLAPEQKAIDLEEEAALAALAAAQLSAGDIDLALVSSFFPDQVDVGNAAFLGERLGLRTAFNLETACGSSVAGLWTARAFLESGQVERVLVVTSCSYSRLCLETDFMCWSNGDGASAFVVERKSGCGGILAGHVISTTSTNGSVVSRPVIEGDRAVIRMRAEKDAGAKIRDVSVPALRTTVHEALGKAGRTLDEVAFFVVNTPLAWYADFAAACLGFSREKTISTHHLYANTGPVLMPTNLFHAAAEEKIRPGDLVVLYGIGSTATAGALVVEWGDVKLGPPPAP